MDHYVRKDRRGFTPYAWLSVRQAVLRIVLQSSTTQRPVSAMRAAHARTFCVDPFMGNVTFSGSLGGSHDHIVPAMGLIGDKAPEFVYCNCESIKGDKPHWTTASTWV